MIKSLLHLICLILPLSAMGQRFYLKHLLLLLRLVALGSQLLQVAAVPPWVRVRKAEDAVLEVNSL